MSEVQPLWLETWWDRKFKRYLAKQSTIVLRSCSYVDEINILVRANSRNINTETKRNIRGSIQHVTNTKHQTIKVTIHYSTRNPNDKLLALGAELWLETEQKSDTPLLL